jgi:translation initiation factor 5
MNIQGYEDNNDPFYRYQMPIPLLTQIKSKTQFTNCEDVCQALARDSKTIMKFLKLLFSCSVKGNLFAKKVSKNEMIDGLRIYIEHFVLCPNCKNPETELNGKIISCKCCNYSGKLIKAKHKVVKKFTY